MAEHLLARGTVAENHREAFAGRGAVAERCREAALWRSICWPGVPWRKTIGKLLVARGAVAELLAGSAMAKRMAAPWRIAIGKLLLARALQRSTIGKQPLLER